MACQRFMVQVQAQIEVEAETEEDACDEAVSRAMEMESTEWGVVILDRGPCKPSKKGKR